MRENKKVLSIVTIIYIGVMVYLLFISRIDGISRMNAYTFSERVTAFTNFIPFRSIMSYGAVFVGGTNSFSVAVINLIGNIVVFIPLGFFFPIHFRKAKRFLGISFITVMTIFLVETVQFVTYTGSFDVDDIILNLVGVWIGFAIWKIYEYVQTCMIERDEVC